MEGSASYSNKPGSSGDREAIFGKIREALKEPAPRHHETPSRSAGSPTVTAPFREWLPQAGEGLQDQIDLFAKLSELLKTEFKVCMDFPEAGAVIKSLAEEGAWKKIAVHEGELTKALCPHIPLTVGLLSTDPGYDKDAMEACDAGLTECESLVAQTGSVCVTNKSSGGRALSVLPPHHIVIARRDQIVPDLSAAFERLAEKYGTSDYPSFTGFITGPSRTGDIERILVLGAHGPKRLSVLLVP